MLWLWILGSLIWFIASVFMAVKNFCSIDGWLGFVVYVALLCCPLSCFVWIFHTKAESDECSIPAESVDSYASDFNDVCCQIRDELFLLKSSTGYSLEIMPYIKSAKELDEDKSQTNNWISNRLDDDVERVIGCIKSGGKEASLKFQAKVICTIGYTDTSVRNYSIYFKRENAEWIINDIDSAIPGYRPKEELLDWEKDIFDQLKAAIHTKKMLHKALTTI